MLRAAPPTPTELLQSRRALGRRLRRLREAHGRTQREVAEAAGLSPRTLLRIEGGHRWPRLEALLALCAALGVSPAVLLEDPAPTNGPRLRAASLLALTHRLPAPAARALSRLLAALAAHLAAGAEAPPPRARRPRRP